jgi:uncharacterized protein YkwD
VWRSGLLVIVATALVAAPALAEPPLGCPSAFELEVVDLVNAERSQLGLAPLQMDVRLMEAAQLHSDDMASNDFVGHTGSNGSSPGQRIEAAGYQPWLAWGENVAAGQTTPAQVVSAWLASPGHRANILSTNFVHIGVGHAFDSTATYDRYWTQTFGRTSSPLQSALANCPACSNGTDDDGDGLVDWNEDLGCRDERSERESSQCDNGIDDDGDGKLDHDGGPLGATPDPQCVGTPWKNQESASSCGLGFELALLLPMLGVVRRYRGR